MGTVLLSVSREVVANSVSAHLPRIFQRSLAADRAHVLLTRGQLGPNGCAAQVTSLHRIWAVLIKVSPGRTTSGSMRLAGRTKLESRAFRWVSHQILHARAPPVLLHRPHMHQGVQYVRALHTSLVASFFRVSTSLVCSWSTILLGSSEHIYSLYLTSPRVGHPSLSLFCFY
jgi:hypothetical protein